MTLLRDATAWKLLLPYLLPSIQTETPRMSEEVVALEKVPPTETGELPTYRPVVSFRVGTAQTIRFQSIAHSNPPEYELGDSVRVLYDPGCPSEARIRSFTSLWLLPIVLGGLGLIFTVLGVVLLLGGIPL